ncbi:hypothetical protein IU438_28935 [Nocardia cyriacigeorgica]|uniref:hypothetical protein n=1 Tax=Nocardia cyriacigeorgica TaxID=135487 RepID=UPI0018952552|nr:hypothetical protein [Nocardia cyriacigeorgica]MBF6399799.1 hypothetical protein [Nocardia cyriacigeorgica]MBF6405372.1 hypothetical protein [Nocardia cyriacigeorgica]
MTNPDPAAKRRKLNQWILGGVGAVLLLIVVIVVAGALVGGGDDEAPAYTSTRDGDVITAVVDFDDAEQLRAVFDDVVANNAGLPEGGYHVQINCSTGGSGAAAARLGNGRFAVGNLGAAQVGLEAGGSTFEPLDGARCPA